MNAKTRYGATALSYACDKEAALEISRSSQMKHPISTSLGACSAAGLTCRRHLFYGEFMYTCANQGVIACYNPKTGERLYQQRIGDKGGS